MTREALDKFRASKGWQAGVDASVALIKVGASGSLDTSTAKQPVIGFVFNQRGLMYDLSLEGTKFTKIKKKY
jgi:lipid-binding SYLF domain-containing protein